jgi:hypothetical protein
LGVDERMGREIELLVVAFDVARDDAVFPGKNDLVDFFRRKERRFNGFSGQGMLCSLVRMSHGRTP